MVIDEILDHNERFVQRNTLSSIGHAPRRRMAVVTCMDCRLVQMFEQALGLERGDVLELRTAGATISKPERADGANDLIRSLAGGIYLLGVREVAVIGHTQCGLAHANPTALTASMQALGVDPQALIEKEKLGNVQGLMNWLGAFDDVAMGVRIAEFFQLVQPFLSFRLIVVHAAIDEQEPSAGPQHAGRLTDK